MENNRGPTLVIHGGAGTIVRNNFTEEKQQEYREALKNSLKVGYEILAKGGNCPLFNAGKGSVFTKGGKNELEASIMLGISSHTAGACTLLHTIKNPIILAKTLLLDPDNPHVFLGGIEAENYAKSKGLEIVDPSYFFTKLRWKQHLDGLEKGKISKNSENMISVIGEDINDEFNQDPTGTVGAVAVDAKGIIAVATST
ncbi:3901_t:CDS:2, partial [Diversispora eburnea]